MSPQPQQTVLGSLQGPAYGLVHLALAAIAYTDENDTNSANIPPKITSALQTLSAPPGLSGSWSMDWGPCIDTDNSNVIFICSFRNGQKGAGTPYFFAVVNRGTDTSSSFTGDIQQIFQDIGSYERKPWSAVLGGSYTNSNGQSLPNPQNLPVPATFNNALIAQGTADALIKVGNYTSGGNNVAAALVSLLTANAGVPVVVTGHSLGGALTQVVATYLAWQAYPTAVANGSAIDGIIPHPIAPPTVGDSVFAGVYDKLFANGGIFWANMMDLVPCAWANVGHVNDLWGSYNWPSPFNPAYNSPPTAGSAGYALGPKDQAVVTGTALLLTGKYKSPSANVRNMTASSLPQPSWLKGDPTKWNTMVLYQHFPPCYSLLIGAVSGVLPYTLPFPAPGPQK